MSVSIEYKEDRDIHEWKIGFITLGDYIYIPHKTPHLLWCGNQDNKK